MFSRGYRAAITIPPLLWVALFLLLPYALLFCFSFWSVSPAQAIIHSWILNNYRELFRVNVYLQTLFRSMWIAARVTIFSLLLGYPLAYYLSFGAGVKKDFLYLGASPLQTFWRVVLPLSIPGVLAGATFAFVLSLGDFLAPLLLGGPSGIMISNIVVSLFGAAYNWPLGAAISFGMLVLVIGLLFLSERLEKKWSFR